MEDHHKPKKQQEQELFQPFFALHEAPKNHRLFHLCEAISKDHWETGSAITWSP